MTNHSVQAAGLPVEELCAQALGAVRRRRQIEGTRPHHVGWLITAGSDLYPVTDRHAAYHQQLAFVCDETGLLASEGAHIDAREFFGREDMGNNSWLKVALQILGNIQHLHSMAPEGHVDDHAPSDWTHQARILHALCSTGTPDGSPRNIVCTLPHGSGRTTAAMLASFHTLVDRFGSSLFVSPTEEAARLVHERIAEFLEKSGWRRAVTLQGFFDRGIEGELFNGEICNIVVATPKGLDRDLLRRNADLAMYIEDLALVAIDSAEEYHGTFGSHAALLFRRLRRLAARHGGHPRFLVSMAPYQDASIHVAQLLGMKTSDFLHVSHNQDFCSRPQRAMAIWTPPFRFNGQAAQTPVNQLKIDRLNIRDGMEGLLNGLAFALEKQGSAGESRRCILVVCKDSVLTPEDAGSILNVMGWSVRIVRSLNEAGADVRSSCDMRAVVFFGFPGMWATWLHEAAHIGNSDSLLVLALGTDPVCQHMLKTAESDFIPYVLIRNQNGVVAKSLPKPVPVSPQRLIINPLSSHIMKAHLHLACLEWPGGLSGREAKEFFGNAGSALLEADREFSCVADLSGKEKRFLSTKNTASLNVDFHCSEWDMGTGDRLTQVRDKGGGVVGNVESALVPILAVPNAPVLIEGHRVELSPRIGPDGNVKSCDSRTIGQVEVGERLSEVKVRPLCPVSSKEHPIRAATRTVTTPALHVALTLAHVGIEEHVVAAACYPGYSHALANSPNTRIKEATAAFETMALCVRLDASNAKGVGTAPTRAMVHTLKHLLKLALRWEYRLPPGECECVLQDGGVVFYDNHPHGDCYARALFKEPIDFWRKMLEHSYELMKECPCQDGCWHCLVIPDCRHAVMGEDKEWRRNQMLDKRGTMDLLGRVLNEANHDWLMFVKYGDGGRPNEE